MLGKKKSDYKYLVGYMKKRNYGIKLTRNFYCNRSSVAAIIHIYLYVYFVYLSTMQTLVSTGM